MISDGDYISGKMVIDKHNRLWTFSKENISYTSLDLLTDSLIVKRVFIPSYMRKEMIGYENISCIDDDKYLFGSTNGYMTIDLSRVNKVSDFFITLNKISLSDGSVIEFNSESINKFKYKYGLITFDYSVPEFVKYSPV